MNLQLVHPPANLTTIESEINQMSEMLRQGWLTVGERLFIVEHDQLYKQSHHKSFTSWLNSLSEKLDTKPSTLWKYLKIVRMIEDINYPKAKINLKNVTGLEQVARIYEATKDVEQVLTLISQLDEKAIKSSDVKKLAKEIVCESLENKVLLENKATFGSFFNNQKYFATLKASAIPIFILSTLTVYWVIELS
ncbi:hypothetical protein [Colwellia polaris]|uniref:hypothetical protein n=1 Tax=Colwellia polaris TaxID=326537 RepID=UPI000A175D4E|nr:hypothetical protein [Colwellia polaris]